MSCLRCVCVLWYEIGLMMPAPVGFGQREPIFLPLDLWCRGTPEFEDQRWCFTAMIQMGDYLILPPTRSSSSWSLSPWRPAAALETNWGAWLQGLCNELVHQVGRRVWIIWLLYFQEREYTMYKLYNKLFYDIYVFLNAVCPIICICLLHWLENFCIDQIVPAGDQMHYWTPSHCQTSQIQVTWLTTPLGVLKSPTRFHLFST